MIHLLRRFFGGLILFLVLAPVHLVQAKEEFRTFALTQGADWGEMVIRHGTSLSIAVTLSKGGESQVGLLQLDALGNQVRSFGKDGLAHLRLNGAQEVYGYAQDQSDQHVIAGLTRIGTKKNIFVARFDDKGQLDPSFGKEGVVTLDLRAQDEIHFLKINSRGEILLAGYVTDKQNSDFLLMSLTPTGALNPLFGQNGLVLLDASTRDQFFGMDLDAQDRLLVTGSQFDNNSQDDCVVYRFTADGHLDKGFGQNGFVKLRFGKMKDVCSALLVQKDGKILVTGFTKTAEKKSLAAVARLLPDGDHDPAFGDSGQKNISAGDGINLPHALSVDKAGCIYVSGQFEQGDARGRLIFHAGVFRLSGSGALDNSWGQRGVRLLPNPKSFRASFEASTMDTQGNFYAVGYQGRKLLLFAPH